MAAIVIEGVDTRTHLKNLLQSQKHIKIIYLIIDEITSGWRSTIGGIYNKLNVEQTNMEKVSVTDINFILLLEKNI